MIGAIAGDIIGSRFEFHPHKSTDFELFTGDDIFTDDTVMTVAIMKAILESKPDYSDLKENTIHWMKKIGRKYPTCGYGGRFLKWVMFSSTEPYNSYGNGSAMRVSPVAIVANSMEETIALSKAVTEVTHNHPEGIKGAEAVAVSMYLLRTGMPKEDVEKYVSEHYYTMNFDLIKERETYQFEVSCQESVPQALKAFFISDDFESAIRMAVSLGGDADTQAAITGSVAEMYYGVPAVIREAALLYLDEELLSIVKEFEATYESENISIKERGASDFTDEMLEELKQSLHKKKSKSATNILSDFYSKLT